MASRRNPPGRRNLAICADPNCPEFATHNGCCPAHQRPRYGTGERGSTRQSRKVRAEVLRESEVDGVPRCFYCGAEAVIADHYEPKALGGTDDKSNLVAACAPCNSTKADDPPQVFMHSIWLARRCEEVAASGRPTA